MANAEVRMANEWYTLAKDNHFWIEWRFNLLLRSLGDLVNQSARILDVGCGDGSTARQLESLGSATVDGCELNQQIVDSTKIGRGQFFYYDILSESLALKDYDAILMLDVVEHIENDLDFMIAAQRHLRPGGKIFISVPSLQSLYSKYDEVAGHVRRYSRQSLVELVRSADFKIVEDYYWGFSLLPLAVMRKVYLNFVDKEKVIERGFEPPSVIISDFLKHLGTLERKILPKPPLGTSLFVVGEKLL